MALRGASVGQKGSHSVSVGDVLMSRGIHGDQLKTEKEVQEMDREQAEQVMKSHDFSSFLMKTSRLVERALDNSVPNPDMFLDHKLLSKKQLEERKQARVEPLLKPVAHLLNHETDGRVCTALAPSPKYPELVMGAFGKSELHDDGLLLIWNMENPSQPEFQFTEASPIMSATFHPFSPHLFCAGTYAGAVVIWDARSPKRLPVARSRRATGRPSAAAS